MRRSATGRHRPPASGCPALCGVPVRDRCWPPGSRKRGGRAESLVSVSQHLLKSCWEGCLCMERRARCSSRDAWVMAECASALGDSIMPPAFNPMSAWEAFARAWDRCCGTGGCSLWGEQTWDRSSQPRGATAKPPTLLWPRLPGALGACQGHGTPATALRYPP